jgi:RNA polymerase sigma-70 factor (ECF subfamily)
MEQPLSMEPSPSDEALMQAVIRGDLAAFEQLVLRHQESVWRTAYRMLGCHQTAEDVAQQAFLRAFEARERYRPTAAFRTYLCRIVARLCLDHLRKRRPVATDGLLPANDWPSPEQRAVYRERAQAVQRAIGCLPPRQRAAVVLRYFEGLRSREVAAAMDTSTKAVERLLARARAALEVSLAGLFQE